MVLSLDSNSLETENLLSSQFCQTAKRLTSFFIADHVPKEQIVRTEQKTRVYY